MKTYSFEKLIVWKKSRNLAVFTYQLTKDFPRDEIFGMVAQMRRASVSVCSNLVEGNSKFSGKEKARYTEISYCSLMELLNQGIISMDLTYMTADHLSQLRHRVDEVALLLTQLRKSQLDR